MLLSVWKMVLTSKLHTNGVEVTLQKVLIEVHKQYFSHFIRIAMVTNECSKRRRVRRKWKNIYLLTLSYLVFRTITSVDVYFRYSFPLSLRCGVNIAEFHKDFA